MQCLIAGKPIIDIEYFGTWTGELESEPSAPLPMIKNYVPQRNSQFCYQFLSLIELILGQCAQASNKLEKWIAFLE